MNKPIKSFLIVDDDPQNNSLSRWALKKSLGQVEIVEFVVPEDGLEYIQSEFMNKSRDEKVTLFLDINMSTMTGWEFLEKFKTFPEPVKEHFDIYLLSSSVDPKDIERAKSNPLIIDFIEKPINKITLLKMFG